MSDKDSSPASDATALGRLLDRLENYYDFACTGGPLKNCLEWQQLRAALAAHREGPTPELRERGAESGMRQDDNGNTVYVYDKSPQEQLEPTLEGNWHAIEGPNGMCACGTEKGGCPERLAAFIRGAVDFWKAKAMFLERERDAAIGELPEAFAVSKGSLKVKVRNYREFMNEVLSATPKAPVVPPVPVEGLDLEPIERRQQEWTYDGDVMAAAIDTDHSKLVAVVKRLRASLAAVEGQE